MAQTVLLVDDDETIRGTARQLLAEEGYNVIVAGDGLEALASERAARSHPARPRDANMDGYGLERELRRRGLRPAIPMVLFTAHAGANQEVKKMGAAALVEKPFDLDASLQTVARAARSQTTE